MQGSRGPGRSPREQPSHFARRVRGDAQIQASSAFDACCSAWGVQSCLRHLADTWSLPQPCRHEPRQLSRDHPLPSALPEPSASVLPSGRHPPEESPRRPPGPRRGPPPVWTAPQARAGRRAPRSRPSGAACPCEGGRSSMQCSCSEGASSDSSHAMSIHPTPFPVMSTMVLRWVFVKKKNKNKKWRLQAAWRSFVMFLCRTEECPKGRCLLVPGTPRPHPWGTARPLPARLCLPWARSGLRA